MAKTLKEILADKAGFADNLSIKVSGVDYTLAELRTLSSEQQTAISKREEELTARANELAKKFDELKAAQISTAELFAEVSRQQEALKKAPGTVDAPDPLEALVNDNIMGPLVKHSRKLEAELAAAKDANVKIASSIQEMAKSYLTDRLTDMYEQAVPEAKRDKYPLELLIRHAMDNKLNTRSGYADIKKAYKELTAPDSLAEQIAAAEQKGREAALKEMNEKGIIVRPPTGVSPGINLGIGTREPSPFKNLDDAFAAASRDSALWAEFNSQTVQ